MKNKKKIAYITGTRADFGLVTPVLRAIEKSPKLSLRLYSTGMHLMPQFGETVHEVEKLFPHAQRIETVFADDSREEQAAFAGALLSNVAALFKKDRPDFVVLLGDRVEMFVIAVACLYLGIPTGHVHGGERTATVDDSARHAISKLASLHFAATTGSAERLKRMGEEKWRVHVVGAPALDVIRNEKLPSPKEVSDFLGLPRGVAFILITQHPVSEEWEDVGAQMRATLAAVTQFKLPVAVTYPNADAGGRRIIAAIEKERNNPLFRIFSNVPYKMFLALERDAAVWVGNSSGALIESCSFGTPVVNIGTRQKGRERGGNVIDAGYDRDDISAAILRSLDGAYRTKLKTLVNPWGNGDSGPRIAAIVEHLPDTKKLLTKQIAY